MWYHLLTWTLVSICMGSHGVVSAQRRSLSDQNTPAQVTHGYWTLKTDPVYRSTHVLFFNPQGEILYQEILSERFIKLTKRNIKRFDTLLDQLMSSKLVMSQLKTTALPLNLSDQFAAIPRSSNTPADLSLQANVRLSKEGKLKVAFHNPGKELVTLQVLDQSGRIIHTNRIWSIHFNQHIDLSQLIAGQYQLNLTSQSQELHYPFEIEIPAVYHLLPPPPATQPGGPLPNSVLEASSVTFF